MVNIIDDYVRESTSEHFRNNELEVCLLDDAKNNKENTKAEFYEEVLDKSPISSNQNFEVLMAQSDRDEPQE